MIPVKSHSYGKILIVMLLLLVFTAFSSYTVSALMVTENVLYVVSDSGSSVHAVYTANNTIKAVIDDVAGIKCIAASTDGKKVYASGSQGIYVINTSTNIASKVANGYTGCLDVAVNPLGNEYYVSAKDASNTQYILVMNAYNDQMTMRFGMGAEGVAVNLAVSPDGTKLYVGTQASMFANLTTYDLTTRAWLNSKRIGITEDIVVKPDGSEVYVACADGENFINAVYVFYANGTLKYKIGNVDWPRGIAVSPDGKKLYIANIGDATVSIYDTASRNFIKTINLTKVDPYNIIISSDGKKLYVSHIGSVNGLSVIDTATYAVSSIENIPGRSYEMVICPVQVSTFFKPPVLSIIPSLTFSPSPSASIASPSPSPSPTATLEPSPSVTATPVVTPTMTAGPSDIPTPCPTPKPTPGFEILAAIMCISIASLLWKKQG